MKNQNFSRLFNQKPLITTCVIAMIILVFTVAPAMAANNQVSDQSVSDAVEDELFMDSATPSYLIDVMTTEGVVTLSGTVGSLLAKERATRIASIVKGVRSVVNNIEVDPAVDRSDKQIKNDVNDALFVDPATDTYEVDVNVTDGVVTLTGKVDSWQEKELCATVAKGVNGVRGMNNNMTIEWPEKRSDPELRAEIEKTLRWNPFVEDALIDVSVDDGDVTLSGTVGSAAEKNEAFWDSFVHGVKSVDTSNLTVERWARDEDLRGKKYVTKSDAEIENAVNDALLYDPRLLSFNVTPEVTGSAVTLRGTVDNLKAKRAAAEDARNTVGVRQVFNRIKVRPTESIDSSKIEKDARQALLRDPYVASYEIAVDVENGVATLSGTVDTFFEKSQADDIVARVNGVIFVDNNLIVEGDFDPYVYDPYVDEWYFYDYDWYNYQPAFPDMSDIRIKINIEDQLFWSPFVDADEVNVEVESGKAILNGTVDSWLEYGAAEDNAYQGGAVIVDNNLTVSM